MAQRSSGDGSCVTVPLATSGCPRSQTAERAQSPSKVPSYLLGLIQLILPQHQPPDLSPPLNSLFSWLKRHHNLSKLLLILFLSCFHSKTLSFKFVFLVFSFFFFFFFSFFFLFFFLGPHLRHTEVPRLGVE